MRFIQRLGYTLYGTISTVLAVFLFVSVSIKNVEANVCFLPDGEECNDGVTRGFWPGSTPDSDIEPERQSGNCDNFTDTTRRNECGQLCQVCAIAGDKNYGKYLCPSAPATGCAQACDCTLSEGAKNQKLASNPCMECEQCTSSECSEVNRGKWRCAINQACQQCQSSGYNKRYDSSEVTASNNGTCSRTQCEPCSDKYNTLEAREWYKCYECDENIYTHNENNLSIEDKTKHCDMNNKCGCFVGCDCFGYDYRLNDCTSEGKEAKDECKGKGGTWYKECVCQGGVTQKKGEGQCWDYNDKCTDASGNKHFNQIENVRPGYKIEGGECVKEQECTYTYKELTYNEIVNYSHGSTPRLWCGVEKNGGFTGGIEFRDSNIAKLAQSNASLLQYSVDSYVKYMDKISESSNSCIRDGVKYFETVCEGTPAHRCRGTYQIFTPKCKSRGYVITPKGNTDDCESTDSAPESYEAATSAAHIWSEEYGDCVKDCPKLGVSYYNNKNECENANSGKKCSQKDQCYRTCEDLNKYSNDCGDNCVYEASSGCYVKDEFTITKSNDTRGCCRNNVYNGCLGWYVALESTGKDTIIIKEMGSRVVPAGDYKICIYREAAYPPQGSHSINISGWSIDSAVNVELSENREHGVCTKDEVYLPARGGMIITPSGITQTCTGNGSSGWFVSY